MDESQLIGYGVQVVWALLMSFLLEWLKRSRWFPFLHEWSAKWWKVAVSAVTAGMSAAGISVHFDPVVGQLLVTGLTLTGIGHALLAFGVSWLSQHALYEGVARRVLPTRAIGLLLAATLVTGTVACAATTARAQAQTTAMVSTELALAVDRAEWDVYGAGVYDQATHQEIGRYIRALLHAERGYVRAVQAWPAGAPAAAPAAVVQARQALQSAAADLQRGLTGIRGTDAILKALEVFEAAFGFSSSPPLGAETGWIGLLLLLMKMIADGRLTREKVLCWLQQDGATIEELAQAERQLTDAINRRDQDLNG